MANSNRPPVSVILPVQPGAGSLSAATLSAWVAGLNAVGHPWELLIVADGVPLSPGVLPNPAGNIRLLSHEAQHGFGACLRTGLAAATHELVATVSLDYRYNPADLRGLLERIDFASEMEDPDTGELVLRKPEMVSGCRTGVPVPSVWAYLGKTYRWFCRLALGLPQDPLPGWYGFSEHLRSWRAWLVYGVPFVDPNSTFKVFRKSAITRFPIQSDGHFALVEIAGKLTFLNGILDEIPLSRSVEPVPKVKWERVDRKAVFGQPKFWQPGTGGATLPTAEA